MTLQAGIRKGQQNILKQSVLSALLFLHPLLQFVTGIRIGEANVGRYTILLDAKSPPAQSSFGPNLAGILAENVIISPPIVSFVSSENAVKSTFRLQFKYTCYSHSIVEGGLLVTSYTMRLT